MALYMAIYDFGSRVAPLKSHLAYYLTLSTSFIATVNRDLLYNGTVIPIFSLKEKMAFK